MPPNVITPQRQLTPAMLPLIDLTQADIDHIVQQVPGGVAIFRISMPYRRCRTVFCSTIYWHRKGIRTC
ncbi:hypothetical protein [Xenorhabdus siamensis]|uniref:hypothetical protein n=1 Tax=Xenorhabdus siamensis TaxID=3136254 RepID=UPI0030F45D57